MIQSFTAFAINEYIFNSTNCNLYLHDIFIRLWVHAIHTISCIFRERKLLFSLFYKQLLAAQWKCYRKFFYARKIFSSFSWSFCHSTTTFIYFSFLQLIVSKEELPPLDVIIPFAIRKSTQQYLSFWQFCNCSA